MSINVLISGGGGDVGQGVAKCLETSTLDVKLFLTCIREDSSWLHKGHTAFIAPLSASEDYVPFLIRLMNKHAIHVFIPTVDSEIAKIAREKERIEAETGALVFVDAPEPVDICEDKNETAHFLRANGFAAPTSAVLGTPEAEALRKELGFPLIAKKRQGQGNTDVFVIKEDAQLDALSGDQSFMLQEWLDPKGGEFTSGIYLGDDGEVKGICTFRRKLKGGSTFIAERVVDPTLEEPLEAIARQLGMKYLNIQSMLRDGVLIPFEFNGRFSGTTAMVGRVFNAPEMYIRERLLGETLERVDDTTLFTAMRYYEEVYSTPDEVDRLKARSTAV
jgi:carbamoyl-phosphate synthase large subunit